MIILSVKNLSFSFGAAPILSGAGFSLDESARCGVVGVNGAGKSTLLQLISGEYEPDEGSIQLAKGLSVGFFRQGGIYEGDILGGSGGNGENGRNGGIGGAAAGSAGANGRPVGDPANLGSAAPGGAGAGANGGAGAGANGSTGAGANGAGNRADGAALGGASAAPAATIGAAVREVFRDVLELEASMRRLEGELSSAPHGSAEQARLIAKYDRARTLFELADGYEYESRIRGVLNGLDIGAGIGDGTPVSILSGGQKTRLALALMLIKPPALLLLDEPTNHLDIRSLEWLEGYLKNYRRAFLVVSHDRYFLDAVTTSTLEIEHRRLAEFGGPYSFYVKKKAENRAAQERLYANQQREIARIEAFIEQQRRWNRERNIIAAESRQKALDRMEKAERPKAAPKKVSIRFNNAISNSNDVMYINGVSKAYGTLRLFEPFSALVRRRDRILILGSNGCGKSTLLRILSGRLEPDGGQLETGGKISVGYYDQEHYDLSDDKAVLDEVYDENARLPLADVRGALAAFLFHGDDVFKKTGSLSGGEKARLALVKLILSRANLLMLDEPTNHLDIGTRETLEDALMNFDGAILSVSHDRYFIRQLATRIFYFEGGRICDFHGGYDAYLAFLAARDDAGGAPGAHGDRNAHGAHGDHGGHGGYGTPRAAAGARVSGAGTGAGADAGIGAGVGRAARPAGASAETGTGTGGASAGTGAGGAAQPEPRGAGLGGTGTGGAAAGASAETGTGTGGASAGTGAGGAAQPEPRGAGPETGGTGTGGAAAGAATGPAQPGPRGSGRHGASAAMGWAAAREYRSLRGRRATRLAKVEAEIDAREKRISSIEAEISSEPIASDHVRLAELAGEHEALSGELDALITEWEELSSALSQ